ncbi:MAG: ribose 5-phosphate isomerase B, partial [Candidatus Omnitrophica bacterium]|nr:ribose 5-phosphate isomerase B [Candidatus Omnitrophota bacterium]
IKDLGTFSRERCDYPKFGYKVARAVATGKFERGVLVCATGIGQSIVANRIPGIRAALCYNIQSARLSRQHNDANILIFGAKFIKKETAKRALEIWLKTEFEGGRHLRRLEQIARIERRLKK